MENTMIQDIPQYLVTRAEYTRRVKEMMIRQLNLDFEPHQLDLDAPLFGMGLGLDSVDALELAIGVEQEFGKTIKDEQKRAFQSVNTIVDFVLGDPAHV